MQLDDLLPYVLNDLPGCPEIMAKQGIILAANEFCQRSLAWNEVQDPVTLRDNVKDYDLDAPSGANPFLIKEAFCGNRQLRPVTFNELQRALPAWQTATSSDPVYYTAATDRTQVTVYPIPLGVPEASKLVLRVSYVPDIKATTIPDFLGSVYLDAIAAGTKSRLMSSPATTYTNSAMAVYYRTVFEDGIATAKAESLHERVPGTVLVTPRLFGF